MTPSLTPPLAGLRVLDFSRVLSGPYASMTLADLGADVVKVEDPKGGDDTRGFGPPFADGVSTYFLSINRGKRSITLDLKRPEDLATARALAERADVVLENFRPGVMGRLGLDYSTLSKFNPRLIYCAISGFGQASDRPGYDLMVQGLSGIPSLTGDAHTPPYKCGASVADLVSGLNAVQGVLAALYRRERTGVGALVDVAMLDGQLSLLTYHAGAYLNAGKVPGRIGNAHPSIHPFCAYATSDGYVNLAIGNDRIWAAFCKAAARPELIEDPRFATNPARVTHRAALDALLGPLFAGRSTSAWLELLERAAVPASRMATVPEALEEAELVTHEHPSGGAPVRSVPLPVRINDAPRAASRRAPGLGEHQAEVLADWGLAEKRPAKATESA